MLSTRCETVRVDILFPKKSHGYYNTRNFTSKGINVNKYKYLETYKASGNKFLKIIEFLIFKCRVTARFKFVRNKKSVQNMSSEEGT